MPFDDDAEADNPGFSPPPHPDDRLWRHPSEMNAHPIVPLGASTPPHIPTPSTAADARRHRPWGAYLAAGALGAVLAGGGVIALGLGERVVERPVTERVALAPTLTGTDDHLSDGLQQGVAPAVVGIEAAPGTTAGGEAAPIAGGEVAPIAGTGVVVRDDGIVVTSAALVAVGAAPTLRLPDGSSVGAEVLAVDQATGLAVVDLAGEGYTPSVLATAADLRSGEQTLVLTSAGRQDATGTVGSTERFVGPSGTALDGVAIAGEAEPDALGGPVVNERGAVVGIVTTVEAGEAWYATPVEVAHKVADDVLADGAVQHCWLGIEGTDVAGEGSAGSPSTTLATEGGGTEVVSVVPDSPADRGGLTPGDVIVALDGEAITRMPDLLLGLRSRSPGDRVEVEVTRADGSQATIELTLTSPPVA
ncbi:MAG: S1C family serine protease [Acidimicrobiales bacterium]|nr:S1C family serine protease [Acidimicrobiales bacterium]